MRPCCVLVALKSKKAVSLACMTGVDRMRKAIRD
jgi:hypothetical protein